jgi:hypothetical protein
MQEEGYHTSDSKMQGQLKRDENGITLSAYTLEKLSRSMWNTPEARTLVLGNQSVGKFRTIQLQQKCRKYESESVNRPTCNSRLYHAALDAMGCGSSKQQVIHKQFIKTFPSFRNVF